MDFDEDPKPTYIKVASAVTLVEMEDVKPWPSKNRWERDASTGSLSNLLMTEPDANTSKHRSRSPGDAGTARPGGIVAAFGSVGRFLRSLLPPGTRRSLDACLEKRWFRLLLINLAIAIILISVLVPVSILVVVPAVFAAIMDSSSMTLVSCDLQNATDTTIFFRSEIALRNAGPFDATLSFGGRPVSVIFEGQQMLNLTLADINVRLSRADIKVAQTAAITNRAVWERFVRQLVDGAAGTNTTMTMFASGVTAYSMGLTVRNIVIRRNLSLANAGGIQPGKLLDFSVVGTTMVTRMRVANPSITSMELGDLQFRLRSSGGPEFATGLATNVSYAAPYFELTIIWAVDKNASGQIGLEALAKSSQPNGGGSIARIVGVGSPAKWLKTLLMNKEVTSPSDSSSDFAIRSTATIITYLPPLIKSKVWVGNPISANITVSKVHSDVYYKGRFAGTADSDIQYVVPPKAVNYPTPEMTFNPSFAGLLIGLDGVGKVYNVTTTMYMRFGDLPEVALTKNHTSTQV